MTVHLFIYLFIYLYLNSGDLDVFSAMANLLLMTFFHLEDLEFFDKSPTLLLIILSYCEVLSPVLHVPTVTKISEVARNPFY